MSIERQISAIGLWQWLHGMKKPMEKIASADQALWYAIQVLMVLANHAGFSVFKSVAKNMQIKYVECARAGVPFRYTRGRTQDVFLTEYVIKEWDRISGNMKFLGGIDCLLAINVIFKMVTHIKQHFSGTCVVSPGIVDSYINEYCKLRKTSELRVKCDRLRTAAVSGRVLWDSALEKAEYIEAPEYSGPQNTAEAS